MTKVVTGKRCLAYASGAVNLELDAARLSGLNYLHLKTEYGRLYWTSPDTWGQSQRRVHY